MDIMQAIAGFVALGVWYGTLAIFGILGFVVNHWVLSIFLGIILAIILYAAWSNSEQDYRPR
ncbi:hypothetical protein [Bradyrhizobium acaciae]|uniref:hypothetical protein n=1 Tax=Bradyrhizobium acaciae TaxID=2683706 RepID=UPI001E53BBCA|nr:hypothetical protein [Bradyrhizobium acaciae]MCC8979268.1 hypothetical protein [Bradyrhizobium acaciae]